MDNRATISCASSESPRPLASSRLIVRFVPSTIAPWRRRTGTRFRYPDRREHLSRDYREPTLKSSAEEAVDHRLRRVYLPLFTALLAARLVRITAFTPESSTSSERSECSLMRPCRCRAVLPRRGDYCRSPSNVGTPRGNSVLRICVDNVATLKTVKSLPSSPMRSVGSTDRYVISIVRSIESPRTEIVQEGSRPFCPVCRSHLNGFRHLAPLIA